MQAHVCCIAVALLRSYSTRMTMQVQKYKTTSIVKLPIVTESLTYKNRIVKDFRSGASWSILSLWTSSESPQVFQGILYGCTLAPRNQIILQIERELQRGQRIKAHIDYYYPTTDSRLGQAGGSCGCRGTSPAQWNRSSASETVISEL